MIPAPVPDDRFGLSPEFRLAQNERLTQHDQPREALQGQETIGNGPRIA